MPKVVPKEIKKISEDEAPPSASMGVAGGVPGGVAGGAVGGVLGGILGGIPSAAPPPPPPPKKEPPKPASIITVGGRVQEAKLIRNPQPVYPPDRASQARISGTVELAAIIGEDGTDSGTATWSAATRCCGRRRWTRSSSGSTSRRCFNEQPVKVSTTIDVNFTLSQ